MTFVYVRASTVVRALAVLVEEVTVRGADVDVLAEKQAASIASFDPECRPAELGWAVAVEGTDCRVPLGLGQAAWAFQRQLEGCI